MSTPQMITFTIGNYKGGVGKTTTAVTIATGLSRRGHKVLLIDTDSQGQCSRYLGIEPADDLFQILIAKQPITKHVQYVNSNHNLALIRSHKETTTAKTVLAARQAPIDTFQNALLPLRKYINFCIVDTAPSVDALALGTLYAADYVLIPTQLERWSLRGVKDIVAMIATIRKQFHGITALLGVIPTMYLSTTTEHRTNLRALATAYQKLVYPVVPTRTTVTASTSHAMTLWDYDPRGEATLAYRKIVDRILRDVLS